MQREEKAFYQKISPDMSDSVAATSMRSLSDFLGRYYGKKVILLLDEYDTPIQEAYVNGYWAELVTFTRSLFNSTFKTSPYLERAIMTGITRVSKESIFSDLNNLEVEPQHQKTRTALVFLSKRKKIFITHGLS